MFCKFFIICLGFVLCICVQTHAIKSLPLETNHFNQTRHPKCKHRKHKLNRSLSFVEE